MKLLLVAAAYLLGSIPTGYLMVRAADRRDIRELGSQSTGATNVFRVKGLRFALPVMVVDVLKGFLPVFVALLLFHDLLWAGICGWAAVIGHCFPFAIGFRGGKGMATSMGVFAALALRPAAGSLVVFVLVIALSRFVSLGSILGVLSFPLFALVDHRAVPVVLTGLAVAVLVVIKHGGNLRRLLAGTERRLGEKFR
jgi:glycerol-3-phosphate acyltransferase PlsY